ncbi:MAG TPA: hypothetical protein VFI37_03045 [Gaiellaceae bacterium]|jgi:hypothetical protein|nr:hypothetical protein [Gaiellaceae bacterium]
MSIQQLPRLSARASLLLAPLLWLASAPLATGATADGDAASVAEIARHPDRYYLFTLLTLVGTMLLVPAVGGLAGLARTRSPLASFVGGGLVQLGVLIGVADSGTQFLSWQTAGGDPAQMASLLHRYETATGASVVFMVGGLSLIAGSLLFAFALRRARVAPLWAAACLPLAMVANIAGFAAGSRTLLAASAAIMLAGFARVALGPIRAADRVESQLSLS